MSLWLLAALACAPHPAPAGDTMATPPALLDAGHLIHRPEGPLGFSAEDFARWGLGGEWTWSPAGPPLELHFELQDGSLRMRSHYGDFVGGVVPEQPLVLALVERTGPPGPPVATWVNLARVDADTFDVVIEAFGGDEDEPTATRVTRR